jgi:hypothetical protein
MKEFKVGQKVVPHSKSHSSVVRGLKESNEWKRAQEKGQPYLYVQRFEQDDVIVCSCKKDASGGDWFLECDLTSYDTLSTGDMINALTANPGQKYKNLRCENEIIAGIKHDGYLAIQENIESGYNPPLVITLQNITDKWTLVPEPPKPITKEEALEAFLNGQDVCCTTYGITHTYSCAHERGKVKRGMVDENGNPISANEILHGTWHIKEE